MRHRSSAVPCRLRRCRLRHKLTGIADAGSAMSMRSGTEVRGMRTLTVLLLMFLLCVIAMFAQDKVAEGEYEMRGVSAKGPVAKTATRWVLTSKSSGGYHLESEIQGQPAGMRVVQIEDLDERLVPTAIGYQLYRKDQKDAGITAKCDFTTGVVVCTGNSGKDRADASRPYRPKGPFWLWMEGLFSLDMPWLLDGAVSMAQLRSGKASIATLTVSGGSGVMIGDAVSVAKLKEVQRPGQTLTVIAPDKPIPWDFSSDEDTTLEFAATESVDLNGVKVAARHYVYGNAEKPMDLWIAGSGFLIRLAGGEETGDFVLVNYKQYEKLIPELPVESRPTGSPPRKPK